MITPSNPKRVKTLSIILVALIVVAVVLEIFIYVPAA